MKLNPSGRQVAIEPMKQSETTLGGVNLPQTAVKLLSEGKVIELGPNVDQKLFHNGIKVGDHVAFSAYAGSWVKLAVRRDNLSHDDNVKLIEDTDVLCIPTEIGVPSAA
jgi:co-chaperonin GroES (HSP10)